jgi:hypothetical protein
MKRISMSLLVLVLSAPLAHAQLRVENVQACYGILGPQREVLEYDLCDDVFIRFNVTGAKADDAQVSLDLTLDLIGPDGASVGHFAKTVGGTLHLNPSYPGFLQCPLNPKWKAGSYTAKVNIRDNHGSGQVSFERVLHIRPTRFALLPPQFFFDKECARPAPHGGFYSQPLFFKSWVVGMDHEASAWDLECRILVLDREGKRVLWEQSRHRENVTDREKMKTDFVTVSGAFLLENGGDYILRIIAVDHVRDLTTAVDAPFHVFDPRQSPTSLVGSHPTSAVGPPLRESRP